MSASSDPVGWLLLRDSHAVPLKGLSPDELKRSCRKAVQIPGLKLKHTTGLKAIVGALGFSGDFGTYTHEHWPRVQEFSGHVNHDPRLLSLLLYQLPYHLLPHACWAAWERWMEVYHRVSPAHFRTGNEHIPRQNANTWVKA